VHGRHDRPAVPGLGPQARMTTAGARSFASIHRSRDARSSSHELRCTRRDPAIRGGTGQLQLVNIKQGGVGRATFLPGWRWSEHVKPIAKTASCQAAHRGGPGHGTGTGRPAPDPLRLARVRCQACAARCVRLAVYPGRRWLRVPDKRVPARAPVGRPAGGAPAWSGGRVRLIAAALKAAGRASVPGVRIPPAPLRTLRD
jgi:hypothetical protein